jgi:hypothetical protein
MLLSCRTTVNLEKGSKAEEQEQSWKTVEKLENSNKVVEQQ